MNQSTYHRVLTIAGSESDDAFFIWPEERIVTLPGVRIPTRNNHGTGSTLSSAIASNLARGEDVETAARLAEEYISASIRAGADYVIGRGHRPVHHFHRFFA